MESCLRDIALTSFESGQILFLDILCPENITSVAPETQLNLFISKPDFRILFKTCSERMSN